MKRTVLTAAIMLLTLAPLCALSSRLTLSASLGGSASWYLMEGEDNPLRGSFSANITAGLAIGDTDSICAGPSLAFERHSMTNVVSSNFYSASSRFVLGLMLRIPLTGSLELETDIGYALGSYDLLDTLCAGPQIALALHWKPASFISLFPRLVLSYNQSDITMDFQVGFGFMSGDLTGGAR